MDAKAQKAYDTAVEIAGHIFITPTFTEKEQRRHARKYVLGCVSTLYTLDLITSEEYDALIKDMKTKFPY